jgi:hypothetical protein
LINFFVSASATPPRIPTVSPSLSPRRPPQSDPLGASQMAESACVLESTACDSE